MTLKNHYQRKTSFLRRNWLSGLTAWQNPTMGNANSSPESDGVPPLKRRRISTPEPFPINHLIAPPAADASESRDSLCVDVLRVFHKDSKRVKANHGGTAPRDSLSTRANCRITISDMTSGWPNVLFCQSQICDVNAFKNPVGPHRVARIAMSHPFFVPVESILVNKPDGSFDTSDAYQLVIELSGVNGGLWPPLDSSDFGFPATSDAHCIMTAKCDRIFGRLKTPLSLTTGPYHHRHTQQTDYVMDVDLRWATGFKAHKGSMPCITAIDPDVEPYVNGSMDTILDDGVNGTDGAHADLFAEHDDLEGDQTPSRSLRTREKSKVYNLKVLSDRARGKEGKRRARGRASSAEGRVTYVLPFDQPICLDYHRCVTCGAYHHSMLELQAHLQSMHSQYDYALDTASQVPQFRITRRYDANTSPSKTYQLGRLAKPFNLETYIAGDQSWLNSRLGHDGVDDVLRSPSSKSFVDRLLSGSPVPKLAAQTASKVATQRRSEQPRHDKVLVPKTSQPMFHPVSKAKLEPGQEVPKITPDSTWLLQKHREAIGDFSDVDPPEKEYIREWDGYILQKNLTTTAYFPRAWLNFVQERAAWLAAAEHRMIEFGKHTSVLLVRDVLNDEVMEQALALINEARANQSPAEKQAVFSDNPDKVDGVPRQSPRASHIRKSTNGCNVCQLPVLGPNFLACSNKTCSYRLYHSDCIEATAVMPVDKPKWLCNICSKPKETS